MEPFITTIITALISSIVGALVGALVAKIKNAAGMMEMQWQNLTMTCRMAIYDDHFSVDEKLDAYVIYRDTCHENHTAKKFMDELVGGDVDDYIEKHRKD